MRVLSFLLLSACIALYPFLARANSLYFDGINDHVDFGDVLDLGNTFTLEAWALLEPGAVGAFPNWDVDIITKVGGAGGPNGYEMVYGLNEEPDRIWGQFNQSGGPWPQYQVISPTAPIHGTWTHIAVTYDNDTMRLYKDGVLVASNAIGPHTVVNTASSLMIGGNANNMNYWQGWIDEVRIWGIARTQEQIQGAMYGSLTGDETGLLGYWNFEDGYGGGTAFDVTSGGYNETLKNGVT